MGSHSPGNAARLIIISLLAFIALSGAAPSAMQPAVARQRSRQRGSHLARSFT